MNNVDDPQSFDHRFATTNGVRLHYVEKGQGPLVLLLHGFPYLWWGWRHQIKGLAAAGYRGSSPRTCAGSARANARLMCTAMRRCRWSAILSAWLTRWRRHPLSSWAMIWGPGLPTPRLNCVLICFGVW